MWFIVFGFKNHHISDERRLKLLTNPWSPDKHFDYKDVVSSADGHKRYFQLNWLTKYPWMVDSASGKAVLCRYCVLFPPLVHRGIHSAFIQKPFLNYRKLHECAKNHMSSEFHKTAKTSAENFLDIKDCQPINVDQQLDNAYPKTIGKMQTKTIR